jgi:hypothetical protein
MSDKLAELNTLQPEIDALVAKVRAMGIGCLFLYEVDGSNIGQPRNDFFYDDSYDVEKHEFLDAIANAAGI